MYIFISKTCGQLCLSLWMGVTENAIQIKVMLKFYKEGVHMITSVNDSKQHFLHLVNKKKLGGKSPNLLPT